MKKFVFIAVIVVVAALLAGPLYFGSVIKASYMAQLDDLPSAQGLEFEHRSYEKGFLGATAVLAILYPLPGQEPTAPPIAVVATIDVKHGPLLFTEDGIILGLSASEVRFDLEGLPDQAKEVVGAFLGEANLKITTRTGFDQTTVAEISMGAIERSEDGTSFSFGGMHGTTTGDASFRTAVGELVIEAISVKSEALEVIISRSSGQFDFEKITDFASAGASNFEIPSIDVVSPTVDLSLKNLSFAMETKEDGDNLDVFEAISIEEIRAPVPVTALDYRVVINDISLKALEVWKDLAADLQQVSGDASDLDPEKFRALFDVALQEGLELNQSLGIDAMGGELTTQLNIRYAGLPGGINPLDIENPLQLLSAIEAVLHVEADESAAMMSPVGGALIGYVQQGIVKLENGKFIVHGELKGGQATLNGAPFPLEAILLNALAST